MLLAASVYLLILIAIGLRSFRSSGTRRSFLAADQRCGAVSVGGSLLATILGSAAVLGTIETATTRGWAAAWFLIAAGIGCLLLVPLAARVRQSHALTLTEMLEHYYGKRAADLSRILVPLAWTGVVAAQLLGAARLAGGFLGVSEVGALAVLTAVCIIYTVLGGQRSVIRTDQLQLFLLAAAAVVLLVMLGPPRPVPGTPPVPGFPFNSLFSPMDLIVLVLTYSTTFLVGPDVYSRLFAARDGVAARRGVLLAAILVGPLAFLLTAVGVSLAAHGKGLEALFQLDATLFPEWARITVALGLFAAVMSSADTTLLSSSSILAERFTRARSLRHGVRIVRVAATMIGCTALLIAIFVQSIIGALLWGLSIFAGACIIPVLAGVLRRRVSGSRAVQAMVAGALCALAGKTLAAVGYASFGNILLVAAFPLNAFVLFRKRARRSDHPVGTARTDRY